MSTDFGVSRNWWDSAFARQGHTGWADQRVYRYDQPVRVASVRRVLQQRHGSGLAGVDSVEVGCGTGDFTMMLHELGSRVFAFDFSPAVLEVAAGRVPASSANPRFACASATAIPVRDQSADLIISITVMQHLVDDSEVLRALTEIGRTLRADGRVVILELAPRVDLPILSADGHVIQRPPQVWHSLFAAAGLEIEAEARYPQWGIAALRWLARSIDRIRSGYRRRANSDVTATDMAAAPSAVQVPSRGIGRDLLHVGLSSTRLALLAVMWPLDHVLRWQVPGKYRYYRLWILRKP